MAERVSKPLPSAASPGIIFDLDGTLANTLDDIADCVNQALTDAGRSAVPLQRIRELIGEGLTNLLSRASGIEDANLLASLVERYRKAYWKRMLNRTQLYDGIAAMMNALIEAGIPVSVLSNKPDEFTVPICAALLKPWPFVRIAGHRSGTLRKPDPAVAIEFANAMDRRPDDMYFVGDSSVDVATGRNAGMKTVAVAWGYRDQPELAAAIPTHLIDAPGELLGVLFGNGPCGQS